MRCLVNNNCANRCLYAVHGLNGKLHALPRVAEPISPCLIVPVSVSPVASPKNRPRVHSTTTVTIRATDFNSIKGTKIFYGSMVAFELVSEGTWLTVSRFCACTVFFPASCTRKQFVRTWSTTFCTRCVWTFGTSSYACVCDGRSATKRSVSRPNSEIVERSMCTSWLTCETPTPFAQSISMTKFGFALLGTLADTKVPRRSYYSDDLWPPDRRIIVPWLCVSGCWNENARSHQSHWQQKKERKISSDRENYGFVQGQTSSDKKIPQPWRIDTLMQGLSCRSTPTCSKNASLRRM